MLSPSSSLCTQLYSAGSRSANMTYFVGTDSKIRERDDSGVGVGQGVRSEEEEDEKKGRLIIKVLQPASPWRTGSEKGFRGLDLSTGDLVPEEGDCGSQSRPPKSPHVPVATAPAALVS